MRIRGSRHDRRAKTGGPRMPAPGAAAGRRPRARAQKSKTPARRSAAMRLTAEVERLERELAAVRREMAELEARADLDPLTGVLNRRGFKRELARTLAYVRRYGAGAALVYLDLDRFKAVNDRHGHAAGDAVLGAVAKALARSVRASDVVGRLGGDEFAVLLWNIGEADALAKARALEQAIGRIATGPAGARLSVGASAGVALFSPLDGVAEALARADRAMYARKAERKASAA